MPDRLRLLGDPTRFKILGFLADPSSDCCSTGVGVCACDIEAFLGLSQPTVSHHMRQLVDAGLVRGERRGRWVYYELSPGALRELATALTAMADAAEERATALAIGAA
ncbi:MAG TPA: metalloregulator ArsR/SmtB family transcription factor [Trueperaceae bacterium]